jgi:2-keto-4-pentenoate hydratase/2-oxohepta-3-ene-1,7-dioic acid hydratase in catechol pathway
VRLATITITRGDHHAALIIDHPRDGSPWAVPLGAAAAVRNWREACRTLHELLVQTGGELGYLRRVADWWLDLLARGIDAVEAVPLERVWLRAPIPTPPLVLGLVGNNAGFVRADHARARNLQLPAGHARPSRSVVGPQDTVEVPADAKRCSGTTELGVVIGRLARDVPPNEVMRYVAGYTIVTDLVVDCYTQQNRARFDVETPTGFHVANAASWLDKSVDTMCGIGPWIVTPDEVPDAYDLLSSFSVQGIRRDRAHSGALLVGLEQLVSWASSLFPLAPGSVLHLGAMGRDGIPVDLEEASRTGGVQIRAEVEKIGSLTNTVSIATATGSSGTHDDSETSTPAFWVVLSNSPNDAAYHQLHDDHPLIAYNTPAPAVATSGTCIQLPATARSIVVAAELAVVIAKRTRHVAPDEVGERLAGYSPLLAVHDESLGRPLLQPHRLSANMPALYARWREHFNVIGEPAPFLAGLSRIACEVDGYPAEVAAIDDYFRPVSNVIAELSDHITLWPGDVVTLGMLTPPIPIRPRELADRLTLSASIVGGPAVSATLLRDASREGEPPADT